MLTVNEYVINLLATDSTIVIDGCEVFYGGVDAIESYPCITVEDIRGSTLTVPNKVRYTYIDFTVYSNVSALQRDTIYERMWTLLNYIKTNTSGTDIYWSLEQATTPHFDTDRKIWSRNCTVRFWAK